MTQYKYLSKAILECGYLNELFNKNAGRKWLTNKVVTKDVNHYELPIVFPTLFRQCLTRFVFKLLNRDGCFSSTHCSDTWDHNQICSNIVGKRCLHCLLEHNSIMIDKGITFHKERWILEQPLLIERERGNLVKNKSWHNNWP